MAWPKMRLISAFKSQIMKIKTDDVLYLFLFLLPCVWILDKAVQAAISLVILILIAVIDRRIHIDRTVYPVLCYVAIHLFSIGYNTFFAGESPDTTRVIAALNTALVWILGSFIFSSVVHMKLDHWTILKIMRFLYAMIILISILSLVLRYTGTELVINGRNLNNIYSDNGTEVRSFCWMEYANLIPFLLLCLVPYVYISIQENKPLIRIFAVAISLLPVLLSRSRLGIVLLFVLIGCITIKEMWRHKRLKVLLLIITAVTVLYILINWGTVTNKVGSMIDSFLNGRGTSNTTRKTLYTLSWERIKSTSLLFGVGIKYITSLPNIPLGSHSTYLGAIYKAGIAGAAFLFFFFGRITCVFYEMTRGKKICKFFLLSFLALLGLMIMEDLDGANWMHFFFFIHLGIVMNLGKAGESMYYASVDNNTAIFSPWRRNKQHRT